mmetsp:Transcript_163949/g.521182  ORF Transcript_163949/g.521182 Transcript_163949/m.521182 type:complete len:839 (-) Transcript_163949:676-3192(-)
MAACCTGDSRLLPDVLPEAVADFAALRGEVQWHEMAHKGGPVPRLVAIQGTVEQDGSYPIYRHPADEQPKLEPWSPLVLQMKGYVEEAVGQEFNHALIQWYRNGDDNISEHADKTLDVKKGTAIINLTLGATRTMVLRTKGNSGGCRETSQPQKRPLEKVRLCHNSVFVLGWETNRSWLHAINKDGRLDMDKSPDELLHGALAIPRLLTPQEEDAEMNDLLQAFSLENRTPDFVWEQAYSKGFGVYNLREAGRASDAAPSRRTALLIIDLQNDFLHEDPRCFMSGRLKNLEALREVLPAVAKVAHDVRSSGGLVVWVRAVYGGWPNGPPAPQRPPVREGAAPNDDFRASLHKGRQPCCARQSFGAEFYPAAAGLIHEADVVLEKRWYSAFTETPLDAMLDAWGVKRVAVCGLVTNVCVQATMVDAFHLGYEPVLIRDACAANGGHDQAVETLQQYGMAVDSTTFASSFPCLSLKHKISCLRFDGVSRLSGFGAGDCILIPKFLSQEVADKLLKRMLGEDEIRWTQLLHVKNASKFPRLTAFQAERSAEGHLPVYRCADPQPWHGQYDTLPWSLSVLKIKPQLEAVAGHSFNWSRILRYRDGNDGMGFHSDKCLDVRKGSYIASLSLGDSREYELQPKDKSSRIPSQTLTLHHGTLLLLGPETNRLFMHSLKKTKQSQKRERISVTFRDIATYHADWDFYGQGTLTPTVQAWRARRRKENSVDSVCAYLLALGGCRLAGGPRTRLGWFSAAVALCLYSLWRVIRRRRRWNEGLRRLAALFPELNKRPLGPDEARELLHGDVLVVPPARAAAGLAGEWWKLLRHDIFRAGGGSDVACSCN